MAITPGTQYYTFDASGNRTVQARGDIRDVITNLDIDKHPILSLFSNESTSDINPKTQEDALTAIDLNNHYAQDADAPAVSDTARTLVDNYTQIFMKTAAVSDTQNAISQYGMGKELLYQEGKKLRELLRDVEAILVSDQAKQAPTLANSYIGLMDGMSTIIASHSSPSLSQENYEKILGDIVEDGGDPRRVFCTRLVKEALATWTTNLTRFTQTTDTIEKEVSVYHGSMGGIVTFDWHPYMPIDVVAEGAQLLLIDPALWVLKELLPLRRMTLPNNGAGPATLFKYELSILCLAEKGNGQIVDQDGVTTTSTTTGT